MRSRSALEGVGLALGAALEGVWCGALAAALTGSSWALLSVFAALLTAAAALLARWTGVGVRRERAGRVVAATLVAAAVVLLLGVGRAWAHDYLLWQVVRDVVFVTLLAFLGIRLGGEEPSPEDAVRRAVRAFVLLCAVLVFAAAAGATPGWATAAVVVALVAGALLIAVMRYRALSDLVVEADRLPSWPWLLAVTGAVLCVVAVAALVNQLLDIDVLRWLLGALAGVLAAVLDALGYVIGWAGAGLLRALQRILALLHVPAPHLELKPPSGTRVKVVVPPYQKAAPASSTTRLLTVASALVAVAGSFAVVVFALRRLRRRTVSDEAVLEEREALGSLRGAAGAAATGLGRRLRRRFARLGRREARSPGELIRLRYAQLERRLAASGRARPPGVTVRDYLASCATAMETPPPATDVAGLYELARYSSHAVDATQAERFEELAQAFES